MPSTEGYNFGKSGPPSGGLLFLRPYYFSQVILRYPIPGENCDNLPALAYDLADKHPDARLFRYPEILDIGFRADAQRLPISDDTVWTRRNLACPTQFLRSLSVELTGP